MHRIYPHHLKRGNSSDAGIAMLSSGCDVNVRDVWLWGYSEEGASCSANRFVRVELELAITVDRGQSIFADSGEEGVLEPCFSGFGEAGSEFFLKLPPSTEDTTSIHADLTIHIHNVASVGHQPTGLGIFTVVLRVPHGAPPGGPVGHAER